MKSLQSAWNVSTYVTSDLPLTDRVIPVLCLQIVFVGERPPSGDVIEAFVETHMRNCKLLISEVAFSPFNPDEFPDL